MTVRVDRAVLKSPWMNRMLTLVVDDEGLYVLHTGPGVRIGFDPGGGLERWAANKVIERGLKQIRAAEVAITNTSPAEMLGDSRHSRLIAYDQIQSVKFEEAGSVFAGRKPTLRLKTSLGKLKIVFQHSPLTDVLPLVQRLSAECSKCQGRR